MVCRRVLVVIVIVSVTMMAIVGCGSTAPSPGVDPPDALRGRCAGTTGLVVPVPGGACDRATAHREPLCGWELTADDGRLVRIDDGTAFVREGDGWVLFGPVYAPDFFDASYTTDGCTVARRTDGGPFPIPDAFASELTGVAHVRDLIGATHGFSALTLQSPLAPTVEEYVALQRCLLEATCDFRDNRIEPIADAGALDGAALRFEAVPPAAGMVTSKASVETQLVHFVSGDRAWLGARIFVAEGRPFGIFDLESTWLPEYPGPRVVVADDGALEVELKWARKTRYAPAGARTPLPLGRWVRVTLELVLDATDGEVRLYQDGALMIDARGPTLPLPNAILNSFEIGIPANGSPDGPTIVLVDSVSASHSEPAER